MEGSQDSTVTARLVKLNWHKVLASTAANKTPLATETVASLRPFDLVIYTFIWVVIFPESSKIKLARPHSADSLEHQQFDSGPESHTQVVTLLHLFFSI